LSLQEAYNELLDELFRFPSVRYAAVLDEFGDRIAGGMKPNVESMTPSSVERKLETQSALMLRMSDDYAKFVGRFRYILLQWEKMIALFFFLTNGTSLSMSMENASSSEAIDQVKLVVERWTVKRSAAKTA
jgi:hypothetical protein